MSRVTFGFAFLAAILAATVAVLSVGALTRSAEKLDPPSAIQSALDSGLLVVDSRVADYFIVTEAGKFEGDVTEAYQAFLAGAPKGRFVREQCVRLQDVDFPNTTRVVTRCSYHRITRKQAIKAIEEAAARAVATGRPAPIS